MTKTAAAPARSARYGDSVRVLAVVIVALAQIVVGVLTGRPAIAAPADVPSQQPSSTTTVAVGTYDVAADTAGRAPAVDVKLAAAEDTTSDRSGHLVAPSRELHAPEAARGVRYVANSAGEVVPYVRGGALEVSEHAVLRMTQRGVDIGLVDDLVTNTRGFSYYHQGVWKTGYYDPGSGLFVGSVNNRITTVIDSASQNYINNLRAARP